MLTMLDFGHRTRVLPSFPSAAQIDWDHVNSDRIDIRLDPEADRSGGTVRCACTRSDCLGCADCRRSFACLCCVFCACVQDNAVKGLPPDEFGFWRYNTNPFELDGKSPHQIFRKFCGPRAHRCVIRRLAGIAGGDDHDEADAGAYLLTYWMARYYKFINV
jgi:hypothetical protein